MQKADSNCSAGTGADSKQKDQDILVSQHSRKPMLCVCAFSFHNKKAISALKHQFLIAVDSL